MTPFSSSIYCLQFGVNICGEGGEYETLTLDCPLFRKRIVLEDTETEVIDDVSFLKIKSAKLVDKNLPEYQSQMEMFRRSVLRSIFLSILLCDAILKCH